VKNPTKVRVYAQVKLKDGSQPYLDPVRTANKRLKLGWAVYGGQPQRFEDAVFYLRYLRSGKRVFERQGGDPEQTLVSKQRIEAWLQALAAGVQAEAPIRGAAQAVKAAEPEGRSLLDCVAEYIAETEAHKRAKTFSAYSETLHLLLQSLQPQNPVDAEVHTLKEYLEDRSLLCRAVRRKHIENITREDVLAYMSFLWQRGNQPRTVFNRVEFLHTFLHRFGLPKADPQTGHRSLLRPNDKPRYTEKKVRAYNAMELKKMFGEATVDEGDLLHFFLGSGTREQEARFACWSDVDLTLKTYTVTEHLDLGYRPKDSEEGTLNIPDVLVERLKNRRMRHPGDRLIFPRNDGKPEGHLLRIIKRLALRAGVNCVHCTNKGGLFCKDHPVCRHVILHKMRKTYASRLHHQGVPARKIMEFLRHSDLDTTLRYLADVEDESTLARINAAIGQFGGAA
jgi:integrase